MYVHGLSRPDPTVFVAPDTATNLVFEILVNDGMLKN